jgi:EAL domain-containing protein (putative c-di-GMP-specific phosphodiesterase class I)
MDDFGTGYSSLSCLRSFPFDKIKIDQSFVRVMNDSLEASSIVSAIIELASNLNISTTAEGIEDEATLNELRRKGCREGQGYFIGRPGSAETAIQLLNAVVGQPITPRRRRHA